MRPQPPSRYAYDAAKHSEAQQHSWLVTALRIHRSTPPLFFTRRQTRNDVRHAVRSLRMARATKAEAWRAYCAAARAVPVLTAAE